MIDKRKDFNMSRYLSLFKAAFQGWQRDKASRLAAALAFYSVLSLAPLLIMVVAIAAMVFSKSAAQESIIAQMEANLGSDVAAFITATLENAARPSSSIIASLLSSFLLMLSASSLFGQLQAALNTVWQVQPAAIRGLLNILRSKLLAFGMVFSISFVLIASLVISAGLRVAKRFITELGLPSSFQFIMPSAELIISFLVMALLFAAIFKWLPQTPVKWRDVWSGGIVTALLFTVGKYLLALYLGGGAVGSAYGAASALVVLLMWIYYSAQILLFGAEYSYAYATTYGSLAEKAAQLPDVESVLSDIRSAETLSRFNQPAPAPPRQSIPALILATLVFVVGLLIGARDTRRP